MNAFIFDVDDTLYDQLQPFAGAYHSMFSRDIDLYALFKSNRKYSDEVFVSSLRGEITMEEMYIYRISRCLEDFGLKISRQEALEFQRRYADGQQHIQMSKTIKKLLTLCTSSCRQETELPVLGVITNGEGKHQQKKVDTLGITQWIPKEHILISGNFQMHKPDVAIFRQAEKLLQLDRENTWFIGDSFRNDILGAKKAGWHAVWLNRRNETPSDKTVFPDYTVKTEEELLQLFQDTLLPR